MLVENTARYGHPVTERKCRSSGEESRFVFKMLHYGDAPEHFNVIIDTRDQHRDLRESMKSRLERMIQKMATCHWWPDVNIHAIAKEILPTTTAVSAALHTRAVGLSKRKADEACAGSLSSARVQEGQTRLRECSKKRPDLVRHNVAETTGDGLCFLRAILQQLRINPEHVWCLAMVVLRYMITHMVDWQEDAADDDMLDERLSVLDSHNLVQYLNRAFPTYSHANVTVSVEESYAAYAIVLDRLQGVVQRDWGEPRLYCDEIFIQAFLDMVQGNLVLVENNARAGNLVTERKCRGKTEASGFVFKWFIMETSQSTST